MRSSIVRVLTAGLTAGCVGCSILAPDACTLNSIYGITVRAQDAATGAPISRDARLVVTDGAYADSSYAWVQNDSIPLSAAAERAGVYSVTVRKPGYITWTQSGVEVTKDACHVRNVKLTASLSKG
ncbi:hypothetical protein BH11GEM2_BH11GEM2_34790 [soil metagenome]